MFVSCCQIKHFYCSGLAACFRVKLHVCSVKQRTVQHERSQQTMKNQTADKSTLKLIKMQTLNQVK